MPLLNCDMLSKKMTFVNIQPVLPIGTILKDVMLSSRQHSAFAIGTGHLSGPSLLLPNACEDARPSVRGTAQFATQMLLESQDHIWQSSPQSERQSADCSGEPICFKSPFAGRQLPCCFRLGADIGKV